MDNKQSGMVTPPIVSPRPIQNQKPLTADESWKIVGSPPRRPLLSPPEERERNRGLQDSDLTTVEGNSTRTIATVTSTVNNDITEFADSTASSVSTGIGNESSPVSSALSSFSPGGSTRHSLTSRHNLADQNQNTGPLSSLMAPSTSHIDRFIAGNGLSPFDEDSPAKESEQQPLHFKSFSTGTPSNVHLDAATSLLDNDDVGLSQSLTGLGREATVTSTGLKQGSIGLESSLSRRPYFWNPIKNVNSQTSTKASSSGRLDAIGPNSGRTARSLSFSDTSFSTTFGLSSNNLTLDQEDEDVLRYRPPLPTMEEETEEPLEPRISRTRSFSTSATLGSNAFPTLSNPMFSGRSTQNAFDLSDGSFATAGLTRDDDKPPLHRKLSGGLSAWPNSTVSGSPPTSHRRAMTSASSYNTQIWESSCPFQPLTSPVRREHHMERQPIPRRFSLAPSSDFQTYDSFLDGMNAGNSSNIGSYNRHPLGNGFAQQAQRRHSVAGFGGIYVRPTPTTFDLTSAMEAFHLGDVVDPNNSWSLNEDPHEEDESQAQGLSTKELGKGLTLSQLSHCGSLYLVEFKAGRSDLFYIPENSGVSLKKGDLVIVEADRGKDLGKITNDMITPQQIQAMQTQQAEMAAIQAQQDGVGSGLGGNGGSSNSTAQRTLKEIHPKRIFRLAQPSEISQLTNKNHDEIKAMMVCQSKVRQKRLPMEVVDAEYQWDRRKLTFYFIAERRIDFRELVRDLFKIYKTRIWMYAVSPSMSQANAGTLHNSPPPSSFAHLPAHQGHQQQMLQHSQGPSTAVVSSALPMGIQSGFQMMQVPHPHQYPPLHATQQYAQYPSYAQIPSQLQEHYQTLLTPHRPPQPSYPSQAQTQASTHLIQQQQQHYQQSPYSYSSVNT